MKLLSIKLLEQQAERRKLRDQTQTAFVVTINNPEIAKQTVQFARAYAELNGTWEAKGDIYALEGKFVAEIGRTTIVIDNDEKGAKISVKCAKNEASEEEAITITKQMIPKNQLGSEDLKVEDHTSKQNVVSNFTREESSEKNYHFD